MYYTHWERTSHSSYPGLYFPPLVASVPRNEGIRLPSLQEVLRQVTFHDLFQRASSVSESSNYQHTRHLSLTPPFVQTSPQTENESTDPDSPPRKLRKRVILRKKLPVPVQVKVPKKRGRKKKEDTQCTHCGLTHTPEWRRGPDGTRTLCNACGLYYLKLCKKFGPRDASNEFAEKKLRNEVLDRVVPAKLTRVVR